jgi:hypothetical protein
LDKKIRRLSRKIRRLRNQKNLDQLEMGILGCSHFLHHYCTFFFRETIIDFTASLIKIIGFFVPPTSPCVFRHKKTPDDCNELVAVGVCPNKFATIVRRLKQFLISLLFLLRPLRDGFFVHPGVVEVAVHFGQLGRTVGGSDCIGIHAERSLDLGF